MFSIYHLVTDEKLFVQKKYFFFFKPFILFRIPFKLHKFNVHQLHAQVNPLILLFLRMRIHEGRKAKPGKLCGQQRK